MFESVQGHPARDHYLLRPVGVCQCGHGGCLHAHVSLLPHRRQSSATEYLHSSGLALGQAYHRRGRSLRFGHVVSCASSFPNIGHIVLIIAVIKLKFMSTHIRLNSNLTQLKFVRASVAP